MGFFKINLLLLLAATHAAYGCQIAKSRLPLNAYEKGQRIFVDSDGCARLADQAQEDKNIEYIVDYYTVEQLPDGYLQKTVVASRPGMSIWGYPLFTKTITIKEIAAAPGQSIKAPPPAPPGGPVGVEVVRPTNNGLFVILAFAIGVIKVVANMGDRIKELEEENKKLMQDLEPTA